MLAVTLAVVALPAAAPAEQATPDKLWERYPLDGGATTPAPPTTTAPTPESKPTPAPAQQPAPTPEAGAQRAGEATEAVGDRSAFEPSEDRFALIALGGCVLLLLAIAVSGRGLLRRSARRRAAAAALRSAPLADGFAPPVKPRHERPAPPPPPPAAPAPEPHARDRRRQRRLIDHGRRR